jgi:hypothetical protein
MIGAGITELANNRGVDGALEAVHHEAVWASGVGSLTDVAGSNRSRRRTVADMIRAPRTRPLRTKMKP